MKPLLNKVACICLFVVGSSINPRASLMLNASGTCFATSRPECALISKHHVFASKVELFDPVQVGLKGHGHDNNVYIVVVLRNSQNIIKVPLRSDISVSPCVVSTNLLCRGFHVIQRAVDL